MVQSYCIQDRGYLLHQRRSPLAIRATATRNLARCNLLIRAVLLNKSGVRGSVQKHSYSNV
eukprot:6658-Heterococcus_DN1.PRE.3